MNTYVVKDPNGNTVLTVNANSIDEAWSKAELLQGASILGYTIEKQYATSTSTLDPIWILMGILVAAMLFGAKERRRYL